MQIPKQYGWFSVPNHLLMLFRYYFFEFFGNFFSKHSVSIHVYIDMRHKVLRLRTLGVSQWPYKNLRMWIYLAGNAAIWWWKLQIFSILLTKCIV